MNSSYKGELEYGIKVRESLSGSIGSHKGSDEEMMQVGISPLLISTEELGLLQKKGNLIYEYEDLVNNLYVEAFTGPDPANLKSLIERRLNSKALLAQREFAIHRPLSVLKRTDETRPGFIVEVQKRCGGLGIFTKWQRAFDENILDVKESGFEIPDLAEFPKILTHLASSCSKSKVIVLVTPSDYLQEQIYLCNIINSESDYIAIPLLKDQLFRIQGTRLYVKGLKSPLTAEGYVWKFHLSRSYLDISMIYRRELNLNDFVELQGWPELYKAYLESRVVIQPELNLMEDTKIPVSIYSELDKLGLLPDHLKNLFPKAVALPDTLTQHFEFGDSRINLEDVINMPADKRNFVVKYAGASIKYGFGGRAVYRLLGMSRSQVSEILKHGISQTVLGSPWMLQECDSTRHESYYLDKQSNEIHYSDKAYARYMFYYLKTGGEVKLVNATSTLRHNHWKATGATDAIVAPIRVKPNVKIEYLQKEGSKKLRTVQ